MQQQRCYQEENGSLPVCRKKVDTGVCLVLLFLWAAACPAQPSQAQAAAVNCGIPSCIPWSTVFPSVFLREVEDAILRCL